MGAIIIGVGLGLAALGIVLGALGAGSSETTSGAALMSVGSTVFVGGLLLAALGSILRALLDIARKLDGAVHFEADEQDYPIQRRTNDVLAADEEDYASASTSFLDREEAPFAAAPSPIAPSPAAPAQPVTRAPASGEATAAGRGLPSWFGRQTPTPEPEPASDFEPARAQETVSDFEVASSFRDEPEELARPDAGHSEPARSEFQRPEFARPEFPRPEFPRHEAPRHETSRVEPPRQFPDRQEPLHRQEAQRPEPPRPELPRSEPARREPPAFLRQGAATPSPVLPPSPAIGDSRADERVSNPSLDEAPHVASHEAPAPEPFVPPPFLSEADLLGDLVEAEPEVTVLKSGTISGMAYKLYSDGSIEADLPDGTLRFASLLELREHVAKAGPARSEG